MPVKKSELYTSLWKSCDELRGGMDASQYKDYVLVLLFMKYVSDKAASQSNYLLDVPEGARFADMVALKGDKEIGDKINKIVAKLAEANDLKGVIDVADFNDADKLGRGKEMVDRLTNLVAIFDNPALDFRGNRAEGDDLLGDAYEFLMRHFATESGKSKGQFYTPAEVSRILAKVVGVRTARTANQTIYDPTCGSGSLLLKAHDEAQNTTGLDLAIYGQEMDVATAALARMNMILHDAPTAEITPGGYSTLANPQFRGRDGGLKTFDYVVANPPFSNKAWRNGFNPAEDEFGRFSAPYVTPPAKNGDYAFLLHILASVKSTGKGACILPHGVLFRGNAEATIRREIVRRGYINGIIGLPANLFYGTSIPACIVVLDKEQAATRSGIFMIDASKGFMKDGNKNRLRAQDIHRIVDVFNRQIEAPRYSRLVPLKEIEENNYNLNLPRYIDSSEAEDIQDIEAHLRGGIPDRDIDALAPYWKIFPTLRTQLFESAGRPGYSRLCLAPSKVPGVIRGHPEVMAFAESVGRLFQRWRSTIEPQLLRFDRDDHPKALIEDLSDSLLETFRAAPLIDAYAVYQRLMDFWTATMQDDVYLITQSGWVDAAKPRALSDGNGQKELVDFVVKDRKFKSDLIPATLLVDKFFVEKKTSAASLESEAKVVGESLDRLVTEHGVEGGMLEAVVDERGKVTKKSLTAQLKEVVSARDTEQYDPEEQRLLSECQAVLERQASIRAQLKAGHDALSAALANRYSALTEEEIKALVVEDKWLAALESEVQREEDAASQALIRRIRDLGERYAMPLPAIVREVDSIAARIDAAADLLRGTSRLPGYIGEWEVRRLRDLFGFLSSANNPHADLSDTGEVGYIHYGDIHAATSPILDCSRVALPRIAAAKVARIPRLRDGDLIMADASEDTGGIGKSVEIRGVGPDQVVAGLHTIVLRPKASVMADGFSGYLQFMPVVREALVRLATGISVYGISKTSVAGIEVRLPALVEQRAIAAVLSDMEAEIEALEARVTKTQALKNAVTQELLSGRPRLP